MSLSEKQEKALLEFVACMAEWTISGKKTLGEYQPLARAYLASLEPQPEPKRGVEDVLEEIIAGCGWVQAGKPGDRAYAAQAKARDALRLYREERERVERALRERDEKRWEAVHGVTNEIKLASLLSKPARQTQELLKIWADRLREAREGRDA